MTEPVAPPIMHEVPPRRRRGGRWFALVTVLVLVALIAGAAFAWLRFAGSPAYSLGLLAVAARDRDWQGVQRYADVQQIAEKGVDKAVDANIEDAPGILGDTARQLAEAAKPALVRQTVQAIKVAVESGRFSRLEGGPLTPLAVAQQVTSTRRTGDEAVVDLRIPQRNGPPLRPKLRMRRSAERWRVIEVVNSNELLATITR